MGPLDPRLARLVPQARGPVAALGAIGVAQGVSTIATAFALSALVLAVVESTPVAVPAALTAGLFVVRGVLGALAERVAAGAGALVSGAVRERLLGVWLGRRIEQRPDATRAATLAAQGCAALEPYVARFVPALVTAAVVPPLAVLTLLVLDWRSGLIVLVTLPLLPLFAALIGASTQADTDARWAALRDLAGHFLDVVRGLPTLVSYGRGERQVDSIADVSRRHRQATMRTLRLAFLSSAALELLATLSVAIVAVAVGLRLTHGSLTLSVALTAILLAPEAYWPIRRVGTEYHSAADGAQALGEILDEIDRPESARTGGPADGRARVRDLDYTYPGAEHPVLRGVSLDASGLTVLTGPSGAGKTTLLEILAGTRAPSAGTLDAAPAHLVTQRPFLGAGTLRANLALGTGADTDRLWWALRDVGLDGVVAALPAGLDTPLGDDGFGLSAGQRARLVLARARLSRASLILLDEPTAHLDVEGSRAVHEVIRSLATTATVVVATHRPELVALADHRLRLDAASAPSAAAASAVSTATSTTTEAPHTTSTEVRR